MNPVLLEMTSAQQIILLVWLGVIGGCFGSFMNVVVYRLPRGKSLIHPGSACPKCGHAIRWYHNLPVVGWLLLRGRCYDCGTPIAARYPLVEAIIAGVFVALALTGPFATEPHVPGRLEAGQLWGVYAWHLALVCVLFCLALIEYDGNPAGDVHYPWSLLLGTLVAGLAALAIWPHLHPVASGLLESESVPGVTSGLVGAVAGVVLGLAAFPATQFGPMQQAGRRYALMNSVLVGLFLGWQAAAALVAVTTVANLPIRAIERRVPWSLVLWGVTLFWLLFWRLLIAEWEMLGQPFPAAAPLLVGSVVVTLAFAWSGAKVFRRSA